MVGVVETARREGIQQGIEQGRRSERLTIAQAMKAAGNSDELIVQVTGLSLEDLEGF